MTKPAKNLIIYADGRVRETEQELLGNRLIESETLPNGDLWHREFQIDWAFLPGKGDSVKARTMVALERSFELWKTAEVWARECAERDRETMRKCLWGIENYPGDK